MPPSSLDCQREVVREKKMRKKDRRKKTRSYSPRAALAAVGLKINSMKLLEPVKQKVVILQKSVRHTPSQKLTDAFIAVLAGAHGLNEINTRVRSDEALQRAFGRKECAEQSVVQETLNACTELNVQQMQQAMGEINRRRGTAYRHKYKEGLQLLDVDMTGMPCGPKQEGSRKGYFGENNIRWGRQLGRVIAAHYEEIVVDQLFTGDVQLRLHCHPCRSARTCGDQHPRQGDRRPRRATQKAPAVHHLLQAEARPAPGPRRLRRARCQTQSEKKKRSGAVRPSPRTRRRPK